jgi:hypothetical protein
MKKLIIAALLLLVWVGSAMGHYLTVDDGTAGQIDVYCDGYVVRVNGSSTGSDNFIYIYDPDAVGSTVWVGFGGAVIDTSQYQLGRGGTATIIESSPLRVVIKFSTNFTSSTSATLTNSTSVDFRLVFYPDSIFYEFKWVIGSGGVNVDNSINNRTVFSAGVAGNLTSEANIEESGGSEASGGNYSSASGDYCGFTSDEINAIVVSLYDSTSSGSLYNYNAGSCGFRWNNTTVAEGTHLHYGFINIDSADREGSAKLYTSTERLEMGDQWKDTTIADPTTGSWVDDLVIPDNVGVDGFASDGALHVEPTSKEAEFTNDITRHKQAIAFEDPHIYTGDTVSGATDHLVGYWPCDDNAASTTIVASVGSNGTLAGGDNTEDKDSADAVRGTSLLLNGTDDYIDLSDAISDLADDEEFTLIVTFKPNFDYDQVGNEGLLTYGHDSNDHMEIYYSFSNDYFSLQGSQHSSITTDAYTSDNEFKQWHTLILSASFSEDCLLFILDGKVLGRETLTSFTDGPDKLYIGYDQYETGNYGAFYIDSIALYDGALLPYGAYFTGNGSVDTDVAHDDILAFVKGDESDSDSLKIGAGTITVTNATHGTGPDGVADSAFQVDATSEIVSIACVDGTNIDNDQGQISFWYRSLGAPVSAYCNYFCHSLGYRKLTLDRNANDTSTRFFIGDSEASFTTTDFNDDNWHYITAAWSTNFRELFVDGISQGTSTTSFTPDALSSGTLVIGNRYDGNRATNALYHAFTITNNPNTPQIPTIMGKPVHVPLIEVE